MLFASIMAGGRGERFWPLSRKRKPKQFLKIKGNKSLLELTYSRIQSLFPRENISVVTRREYGDKIRALLPDTVVLEEPVGKNTAPACFYSAWWVEKQNPDGIVVVLPSDHWIEGEEKYRETIIAGVELAREGYLVTFGIKPTRPETGYGYIERGEPLGTPEDISAFKVQQFREKPSREKAEEFLREGRFYWNSGMFVWKAEALLEAFRKHAPQFFEIVEKADLGSREGVEYFYSQVPEISIDYLIMEKATNRAVIEATFLWEDLGSFASLTSILEVTSSENYVRGDHLALDARNNVLVSKGGLVAVLGIEGLAVIHTPDVTLVIPLKDAQRVKEIVKKLEKLDEFKKYIE